MTRFRNSLCIAALGVTLGGLNGCGTYSGSPSTSPDSRAPATLPPGYVKTYVVFGKRYYVMGSADGYSEKGLASWYGPKFHGRKTANGETYDMHGITAAHKSLPLGTWVRVTNLSNQRTLDMRINDRGPFVNNRIIDLSLGAARKLGVVGPGTAPVHVVALDGDPTRSPGERAAHSTVTARIQGPEPASITATIERPAVIESRPAPPQPSPAPDVSATPVAAAGPAGAPAAPSDTVSPASRSGYIQVASFGDEANAMRMASQLEQSGFNNVIIQALTVDDKLLHRVRLGPLMSALQQQDILDKLASMGLRGARFVSR